MLPDTNRDKHWHTAFSTFTCHSICGSLRWICALKIHSATRRQNPIPTFARNSICVTCVHVLNGDSRCIVRMNTKVGSSQHWFAYRCRSVRRKLAGEQWSRRETIEAQETKWNFDVEMDSGKSWTTCDFTSRWRNADSDGTGRNSSQCHHLHIQQSRRA